MYVDARAAPSPLRLQLTTHNTSGRLQYSRSSTLAYIRPLFLHKSKKRGVPEHSNYLFHGAESLRGTIGQEPPRFYGIQCSQKPATGSYSEPHPHIVFV
jgi:hypothetical protein